MSGEMVDLLQSVETDWDVVDLFGAGAEDRITERPHVLTDAGSSLRTVAEEFQGRRPVHAAHARRLAEDVDRLLTDLRQAGRS